MPARRITTLTYAAPCGTLTLASYGSELCLCDWQGEGGHSLACLTRLQRYLQAAIEPGNSPTLQHAAAELDEYFAGERRSFTTPLLFIGTAFQKSAWQQLLHIPYGDTISYGEQARRLGLPTATRAVARANGANALFLFAPCHRVIGSDGRLAGYGGGLATKRFLLELEGSCASAAATSSNKKLDSAATLVYPTRSL